MLKQRERNEVNWSFGKCEYRFCLLVAYLSFFLYWIIVEIWKRNESIILEELTQGKERDTFQSHSLCVSDYFLSLYVQLCIKWWCWYLSCSQMRPVPPSPLSAPHRNFLCVHPIKALLKCASYQFVKIITACFVTKEIGDWMWQKSEPDDGIGFQIK